MNWDDQHVRDDFYQRLDNSTVLHRCIKRVKGKVEVSRKPFLLINEIRINKKKSFVMIDEVLHPCIKVCLKLYQIINILANKEPFISK